MKPLIIFLSVIFCTSLFSQPNSRSLQMVSFSGKGYDLGLQHGRTLKNEIASIITAWKKNTSAVLKKNADEVLDDFYNYGNFEQAIQQWTPELYDEVRGIADGSGQSFNDVLVLNLLDEFWVYVNNLNNHHCSGVGVPAQGNQPGFISQNMDLESYTDGFQVMMRLQRTDDQPEQLILTHPGLIGLNGMNETGVGVCVNTIMQLKATSHGLPVAFIIRHLIQSTDKEKILDFIQTVPHASGQNYIIGIRGEVFDFEASADQVVRFNPMKANGTVYHTNHPIANDDVKDWFQEFNPKLPEQSRPTGNNSYARFKALENRIANAPEVTEMMVKNTLRSRDDQNNPVCRTNMQNGNGYTFASIIMTMADKPYIQVTSGPPDESDYQRYDFTANQ